MESKITTKENVQKQSDGINVETKESLPTSNQNKLTSRTMKSNLDTKEQYATSKTKINLPVPHHGIPH